MNVSGCMFEGLEQWDRIYHTVKLVGAIHDQDKAIKKALKLPNCAILRAR